MIRRSLDYRAPASVSINLYKALIQPIIEYSAPVWSPFTKIQIKSIERIQRNFTRYALHYFTINYKKRCEYLNILPLSFRSEMIDIKLLLNLSLCQIFLILSHLYWVTTNQTVEFGQVRTDQSFIRGKLELRRLKDFIQIEWSVFVIDYQRICVKNNLWTWYLDYHNQHVITQ